MNRKTFFKTLLGGAAVAVIAPQILAEKKDDVLAVDVATIPRGMPLSEVIGEYKKTGSLPYGVHGEYINAEIMARLYEEYRDKGLFVTLNSFNKR